jgi:hypothetical protein
VTEGAPEWVDLGEYYYMERRRRAAPH